MKRDLLRPAHVGPPVAVLDPATQGECSVINEGASDDPLDRTAHAALAIATSGLSPASACLAWLDWGLHLVASPGKCLTLAMEAGRVLTGAGPQWSADMHVQERQPATVIDPRFVDPSWQRWPFCAYRDAFLRIEAWGQHATTGVRGVEAHHEQLAQFFARQWADAFSPSNFVLTNPLVLETALKTGGLTL